MNTHTKAMLLWAVTVTASALALAGCHTGLSPVDPSWDWVWTNQASGPVFTKLTSLEEDKAIGSPELIAFERSGARVFRMAYAQGGTDDRGRIGMAESADGLTWTRVAPLSGGAQAPSVLQPGPEGSWDGWFLDTPALLLHQGVWYLWYFGNNSNQIPGGSIGLATSTDGLNFTRVQAEPVLNPGSGDAWDSLWVESPVVVHDGSQFVMYYTGVDAVWRPRVGRATSPDGIRWTKETANPVLDRGPSGAWDSFAAAVPDVVFRNGEWQLFYCAQSEFESALGLRSPKIGLAYSDDGIHFTKYANNPLLDAWAVGLAPNGPYNPSVWFDETSQRYLLWSESGLGFHLAAAPAIPGR